MFLWVWFFRRENYAVFRNWFWITNGLAVIGYWLYPLAPPRLTDLGFSDPTKESLELGGALSWFQPFRNEFAAMPSMHVGYTLLFSLTLFFLLAPSRWRWLAFLWPAGMLFVVMATSNHWWLDGVGGACLRAARPVHRRPRLRAGHAAPVAEARPPMRVAMVTEYAYPVLGGHPGARAQPRPGAWSRAGTR